MSDEDTNADLIARAKKVLAGLDDTDAQWLRFKVADAGERLCFTPGYSRPVALRMQRLGLVSKSTQRGTWLVEPLGQIVNGVRVARLTNTHRACLNLILGEEVCRSDRAEPVIRQYGDRGKQAIADLRAAGLVDVLHMSLTDVGRTVTRMVAEGAGGESHG